MRIQMLAAFAATVLTAAPAIAGGETIAAKKARGCTVTQASLPIGKLPTLGPVVRCPEARAATQNCATHLHHTPSGKMSTVRRCESVATAD